MSDQPFLPGESDGSLAAEYALGLAEGADRARAEALIASDPAFAAEVAGWQLRLAPLEIAIPAVPPPARVWPRIAGAIGAERPATPARRAGLWQSLAFWRWISAGTLAAAAATVVAVVVVSQDTALEPIMMARLATDDGRMEYMSVVSPDRSAVLVVPLAATGYDGTVPELWVIGTDGVPHSLGILSTTRAHTVPLPSDMVALMTEPAVLAITREPPGGAPGGVPSGPVMSRGDVVTL